MPENGIVGEMFCFCCRRFEPQLRLMHDRIRAGEIGRVRSLRSTNRDTPQMMNPAYLALSGNNNTAVANIRFPLNMHENATGYGQRAGGTHPTGMYCCRTIVCISKRDIPGQVCT